MRGRGRVGIVPSARRRHSRCSGDGGSGAPAAHDNDHSHLRAPVLRVLGGGGRASELASERASERAQWLNYSGFAHARACARAFIKGGTPRALQTSPASRRATPPAGKREDENEGAGEGWIPFVRPPPLPFTHTHTHPIASARYRFYACVCVYV